MSKKNTRILGLLIPVVLGITMFLVFSHLSRAYAAPLLDTHVGGTIDTDTTWTLANSPYVVDSDVTVAAGVTLTVEAGVVVKFDTDTGTGDQLIIHGTLLAQGTSGNEIYFTSIRDDDVGGDTNGDGSTTSAAAGDWQDIHLGSDSHTVLDHVVVRYGGGGMSNGGMIASYSYTQGATLEMNESTVSNSATDGLYLQWWPVPPETPENTIIINNSITNIKHLNHISSTAIVECTISNGKIYV